MDFQDRTNVEDNETVASDGAVAPAGGRSGTPTVVLQPDVNNVVSLPSGVSFDDIVADGRDLVILADGVRYIIPEGAIIVPQLVVDGVIVPPLNLAALLVGNEITPAAGPGVQSSGGNFETAPGDIQDAYGLGDLLPYTELAFPQPEEEEIIPNNNTKPTVIVITPDNPVGAVDAIAQVNEAGLPERGEEPAGSESQTDSETTSGTISYTAPDGTDAVLINGVAITSIGQTFVSPDGTLTITSIAEGAIGFSYTLDDNLIGLTEDGFFTVTVVDSDGDEAHASLLIHVLDDVPTARDDADLVEAGTYGPETGNVISGDGTTTGAAGADTPGADDALVTSVSNADGQSAASDEGPMVIEGEYGTLTIEANGDYTYVRNPGTPGGVSDAFTYTLTDGDDDNSTAILTINIGDSPAVVISVPEIGEPGTVVDEAGLPERADEAPGTAAPTPAETTSGTISFSAPDGPPTVTIDSTVTINGTVITGSGQTIAAPEGTLTIITYDPVAGIIDYSFTLNDNTAGDETSVTFDVTVTDVDGDSDTGSFTITIVDDVPLAADDVGTQAGEDAPITVDVFANDIQGADSVQPGAIAAVDGTLSGNGTLVYNGDHTFTYTPAPGEEGTVQFDYTITDGDGDSSTATVTIPLGEDSTPTISAEGENFVDEAGLPARASEPAGSDAASDSEITAGVINITTGGDTVGSLVINGIDVTNGGTVTTAKGALIITLDAGEYKYAYTLADNTLTDPDSDSFTLTITDSDGDPASTTLVIAIADDTPSAQDDAANLGAGTYGPVTGSVTDNDTSGADDFSVTSYSGAGGAGAAGAVVQGAYGTLTIDGDGNFSYDRDPGTPGGVADTFTYVVTDGDGDTANADLIINIADSPVTLDLPVTGEAGTQVLEEGLASGSAAASDGEFTAGTIAFGAPDGPGIVTIDGAAVTTVGQTFSGSFGTLTITSIADGAIGYDYELTTNTNGDDTKDNFAIIVSDVDGDSAPGTLTIDIVDDVPSARPDVDSVAEDGPLIADGNVITGSGGTDANSSDGVADTQGADGAAVVAVSFGAAAGTLGSGLAGDYGSLILNGDGSYRYELDNSNPLVQGLGTTEQLTETFNYTIIDGDSDESSATLVITINGADDGVTINGLDGDGSEETLFENDLVDGSSPDAPSLTQTGSFDLTAPDGLSTITVGGTIVYTGGAFVPGQTLTTAYGTLSITGVTPTTTDANGDVTAASVSYTYELTDNTLTHTGANDVSLTDSFAVVVTDTDGSSAADSIDITVNDDVPDAQDDAAAQAAENQAFTIDALANDVFGADGVDIADVADVFVASQPTYGTVTYNPATGLFTYTPDAGAGSDSLSDSFTYTIVDRDGDSSTATVAITLQPDSTPEVAFVTALSDDDGLSGNNPASVTNDINANAGDAPLSASEAVYSGQINVDFGNDTGSVSFANLDGTSGAVGTETVDYTWDAGSATLTATGPRGVLFTIALDPDGTFVLTQLDNVLHQAGNEETSAANVVLNYRASDSDGDNDSTGTLTLTLNDDAPTASAETDTLAEGATVTGTLDFVAGADGASVTAIDGTALTFGGDGFSQSIDIGNGSIKVKANGEYSFTADDPVANPATADATFTVTDGDGDTATAPITFTLTDANAPTGGSASASVDDDGLSGGNAASTTGDLAVPNSDGDNDESTFSGTLTFTPGGDTPATISFASSVDGSTATVGLETVTYSVAGNVLTATGPRGVLFTVEITDAQAGTYTVSLEDNVLNAGGPNDEAIDATAAIGFTVTDNDGSTASSTLNITFDDDAPTASADTNSVGEGGTVGGNVLTDGTDDVFGADGPAETTPAGGVVGFDAGSDISVAATGTPGTKIESTLGFLTLNADGSYSYESKPNSTNVDVDDVFTYTIQDADGDLSTQTLTISIDDVSGRVSDNDVLVDESGLDGIGSQIVPAGEFDTDGQITVTGAAGTLTYTLTDPANGTFGTLVLDSVTGAYTYTLDTPVTDTTGDDGRNTITGPANGAEAFGYTVTDASSNIIGSGTITINIVDDVPSAADDLGQSIAEDATTPASLSGNVMTNDTQGADAASVTSVNIGGTDYAIAAAGSTPIALANGSYTFDAAGNWTFDPNPNLNQTAGAVDASFTYTLTDGDGDTDTATQPITITDGAGPIAGPPVTLTLDDENLASGSAPAVPVDDSDTILFTAGSDAIASIVFGNTAGLDASLTWVRVDDDTITGSDGSDLIVTLELTVTGTTATVTATLSDNYADHPLSGDETFDLGSVSVIATDIDGTSATGTVNVDISDDVPNVTGSDPAANALEVDDTTIGTPDTADFSALFTAQFYADGPSAVGSIVYALGVSASGVDSGMDDVATGQDVLLRVNVSGDVEGYITDGGTGTVVFTLAIDTAGTATLTQARAVEHSDASDANDPTGLVGSDLITLTATVTDGDNDTDSDIVDLTGGLTFYDDGPSIDASVSDADTVQLVMQDAETDGDPTDFDTASADFSGAFTIASSNYGADGAGVTGWEFSLILKAAEGSDTGLSSNGATIYLYQAADGTVIGSTSSTKGGITAGNTIFDLTISAAGSVTSTQYAELDHSVSDVASYDSEELPLPTGLVAISGEATITDRDGDSASETLELDLGGNVIFADDGPSASVTGAVPTLNVDETQLATDDSDSFANVFTTAYGADGAGTTAYSLSVQSAGAVSGLVDTATGNGVFLFLESGTIVGREGTNATDALTGDQVFTVSVDTLGNVELDQIRAVIHADDTDPDDVTGLAADNLISLTVTVTDGEGAANGDTATASVDIGSDLTFNDDGPTTNAVNSSGSVDEDGLSGGLAGAEAQNPGDITGEAVSAGGTVVGLFNSGADAPLTYHLSDVTAGLPALSSGETPLVYGVVGNVLTATVGPAGPTAFTFTLNENTGAWTFVLAAPLDHPDGNGENDITIDFGGLISASDADNDSIDAVGSLNVLIDDDSPVAVDDGELASVDDNVSGVTIGTVAGITGNDNFGADGPADPSLISVSAGSLGGSIAVVAGNLVFTSGTDITDPYADQVETFTYVIEDADGDQSTGSFTVRLTDGGPAINSAAASIAVDEEGLPGGLAGGIGDLAGVNTTQTGNLAGLNFGTDGAGGIALAAVADTGLVTLAGNAIETVWDGTTLLGQDAVTGDDVFTLEITDVATGAYSFTLLSTLKHSDPDSEDDLTLDITVTVTDAEGESASGTVSLLIDDDRPVAVDAFDLTTLLNQAGQTGSAYLDSDNDIDNNFGADGADVIFTAASITSLEGQSLTSGLSALSYSISPDGAVLTATKDSDSSTVFTITLDPASADDQYVVNLIQALDSTSDVDFNDGGYDFVGGNGSWAGFNQPTTTGSQDLLITPQENGVNAGTINTNANEGGVSAGNSVGSGEVFRVDFVTDLAGSPNSGQDYALPANQNHSFNGHYSVNGASAFFTKITGASSVTVEAFDDTDGDNILGDGVQDSITSIGISYNAATLVIDADGTYNVGGRSFTVTFSGGIATVDNVGEDTRIAAYTADGYTSIEFGYAGGDTFKIGDFGATTLTDDPVPFTVPISVQDNDGDIVDSGILDITLGSTTTTTAAAGASLMLLSSVDGTGGNLQASDPAQLNIGSGQRGMQFANIAAMAVAAAGMDNLGGNVFDLSGTPFAGKAVGQDAFLVTGTLANNGLADQDTVISENAPGAAAGQQAAPSSQSISNEGLEMVALGGAEAAPDNDLSEGGFAPDGSAFAFGAASPAPVLAALSVEGTQMMDALLTMGSAPELDGQSPSQILVPVSGAKATHDMPELQEAFIDVADGHLIDAIVNHFAGELGDPAAAMAGQFDAALPIGLLDIGIGDGYASFAQGIAGMSAGLDLIADDMSALGASA